MENLWLIGLPGCGKSSLGRAAAAALGLAFRDTDEDIEKGEGLSIREIFARQGEAYFRERERKTIQACARNRGQVIATGGGAVLDGDNRNCMRKSGLVVFLDRPPEKIAKDLETGTRPLLSGGIERLFILAKERRWFYEEAAGAALALSGGEEDSLAELLALVRGETVTEGYSLIGAPVAHSLSPAIHECVFQNLGLSLRYRTVHVPRGALSGFLRRVREQNLPGFNVTIPHKRDILPLLDEVEESARRCGSVNTVVNEQGRLRGYNTDREGFLLSLREKGRGFQGEIAAILGTGGAAIPLAHKAAEEGAVSLLLLGRDAQTAAKIAGEIAGLYPACPVSSGAFDHRLPRLSLENVSLLINATPLGMSGTGEDFGDFAFLDTLSPGALCCDIVFNPPRTAFLQAAADRGLETLNGLGMLIYQALLADELFLNRTLDIPLLTTKVQMALAAGNVQEGRKKQ